MKLSTALLRMRPPPGADEHGQEDGGPAGEGDQARVLVIVGGIEEQRQHGEVDHDDDQSCVQPGLHVGVEEAGDPGQEAQGGHIAQTGRYGCGHIVRVTVG